MLIRRARAADAAGLTALAVRSKSHWPYPADVVARFPAVLTMTPEVIAANEVWVAEHDGVVRGFCTLLHRGPVAILDDLWIEPDAMGRGLGRQLFAHAAARALAAGATTLQWDADPHAVGFYERMGGTRVGFVDSPLGRPLPVMRLRLDGPSLTPAAHPRTT